MNNGLLINSGWKLAKCIVRQFTSIQPVVFITTHPRSAWQRQMPPRHFFGLCFWARMGSEMAAALGYGSPKSLVCPERGGQRWGRAPQTSSEPAAGLKLESQAPPGRETQSVTFRTSLLSWYMRDVLKEQVDRFRFKRNNCSSEAFYFRGRQ